MSSRDALLSTLALVAFGAVAASTTPAEASTNPAQVCAAIGAAQDASEVRRHLADPDCGAVAVGRLLELQGGLTQVAQAGQDTPLCLYKIDDPRYRLDPRCPPLIMPTDRGRSSESSPEWSPSPSGGGGGYPG